jgi:hypothetical protein
MKKKNGGSMCMPRFIYRVHDGNHEERCDIVQFKLQRSPDAETIDHEKRVHDLIKHYRGGTMENFVKDKPVVQGKSGRYYIARYDRDPQFDAESATCPDQEAYAKQILHWLGRVHRRQNLEYANEFDKKFETTRHELKAMLNSHIAYAKKRAGELKPYKCGQRVIPLARLPDRATLP